MKVKASRRALRAAGLEKIIIIIIIKRRLKSAF